MTGRGTNRGGRGGNRVVGGRGFDKSKQTSKNSGATHDKTNTEPDLQQSRFNILAHACIYCDEICIDEEGRYSEVAIQCSHCLTWAHKDCTPFASDTIEVMLEKGPFICNECKNFLSSQSGSSEADDSRYADDRIPSEENLCRDQNQDRKQSSPSELINTPYTNSQVVSYDTREGQTEKPPVPTRVINNQSTTDVSKASTVPVNKSQVGLNAQLTSQIIPNKDVRPKVKPIEQTGDPVAKPRTLLNDQWSEPRDNERYRGQSYNFDSTPHGYGLSEMPNRHLINHEPNTHDTYMTKFDELMKELREIKSETKSLGNKVNILDDI